jgi:hypothetical protein
MTRTAESLLEQAQELLSWIDVAESFGDMEELERIRAEVEEIEHYLERIADGEAR